jgi:hypothetical protein
MPEQGRKGDMPPINPECQLDPLELRLLGLLERRRHRRARKGGVYRVNALSIARVLGIRPTSSDDSKKKGVRNLVRGMRDKGVPIVSDLRGYWLAVESADFAAYHQLLRRMGLTHLAAASRSKRSSASAEAAGQMAMF